ncbi:MAG: hypothetical protein ACRCT1_10580 [Microcoleaceae cyanobacterium]
MPAVRAHFEIAGATGYKLKLTENYTDIATELGLTKVALTAPGIAISTGEAIARRYGSRIRITYASSPTAKRRTSALIFCAADKEDTAIGAVTGKQFGANNVIVSAGYPRRARFH